MCFKFYDGQNKMEIYASALIVFVVVHVLSATHMQMRQTLEVRLAAAEELRKAAEQEKLEKEESAGNALAEQGIIMEKVVLESKLLQQEAEENSKVANRCALCDNWYYGASTK